MVVANGSPNVVFGGVTPRFLPHKQTILAQQSICVRAKMKNIGGQGVIGGIGKSYMHALRHPVYVLA